MNIEIKKLVKNAIIPSYAKFGDAGMDLTATSKHYDEFGNVVYGIGIAIAIPLNHVGLIFPRSSNSKQDLLLSNSVGVIDSGYRGELMLKFKPSGVFCDNDYGVDTIGTEFEFITFSDSIDNYSDYEVGDRIGQIIILPYPSINYVEVNELTETERGTSGYGSTGK